MRFQLRIIPVCLGLDWDFTILDALEMSIQEIFLYGSGNNIDLHIQHEDPFYPAPLSDITKWHLQEIVDSSLNNSGAPAGELAVLVAPRWEHRPGNIRDYV